MKKIIKRTILITLLLALALAVAYFVPSIIKVLNLQKEAIAIVKSSSKSTFMETKTTIVYDAYDEELCQIKNIKDMYYVDFSEIPETLADAFIVMEDHDFYSHKGIDYKAIIRATFVNKQRGEIVQGASTITQQLARNIFLSQEVTWDRKIEEMFIAGEMEKRYSKDQILEFYLNNIYFGNGYYGVEAAAKGYFSKHVSELTLPEQAFIAAIPNGPTKYNPLTNFENTDTRRKLILRKLYDEDYISSMTFYTSYHEEVVLALADNSEVSDSVATYVRHCATESLMEAVGFTFRYNFDSEDDYNSYMDMYDSYYNRYQQMLVGGGYTIYTSIDRDIQDKLQNALDEGLSGYTEVSDEGIYKMQGSATCIDNETGNVVAIVGSRSQDGPSLGLNRAYQSYRQSGSAIKPLSVYLPYFMKGHFPEETMTDEYIPGGPLNADRSYAGEMTLADAIKYSKNTIAWKVYQEVTPQVGISYLMKMGFKKVWYDKDYNAAALGGFTYGVTSEEMAGAFATIANDGVYRKATCIRKIYGPEGKLIRDESERGGRVYSSMICREMTEVLQTVVNGGGTGGAAAVDGWEIAGKTGSTNSDKDLWFCGYSPYYTTAVWMGYDYPEQIHGGNATTIIFREFMTQIHEGLVHKSFPQAKHNNSGNSGNSGNTNNEPATINPEDNTEYQEPETFGNGQEQDGQNINNAGVTDGDVLQGTTGTGTAGTTGSANSGTTGATGSGTTGTAGTAGNQGTSGTTASSNNRNDNATMVYPGTDVDTDVSGYQDKDAPVRGDADAGTIQ